MKKLRVSSAFTIHSYPKDDLSEYVRVGLDFYKEAGFDAADFGTGLLDLSSDAWKPQVEQILDLSNKADFRFELCHLPFMGGSAKSEEYVAEFNIKMHRAIDAAAALGVDYAVMHPNAVTLPLKKYARNEQFDSVMSHLSPFVEHANKVGLNVVVENMRIMPKFTVSHRYCQTADELCEVADALGIGICWDFGHANISGVRQSEALAYIGKRLKVLHVNDNTAFEDDHLPPFTGNVDWKDAMHGLALAEFDGLFNYEVAVGRSPAGMRKAYAAYLLAAANELMTYIE
ncbi:MAG: sugar phosphate isomerase/epimerase [Clostridia bacterium]|nr:sugar phosphate isomerase/epimerase [Clostridia bacterium]